MGGGLCRGKWWRLRTQQGLQEVVGEELARGIWTPAWRMAEGFELGGMMRFFVLEKISLARDPRTDQKKELAGEQPGGSCQKAST